MRRSERARRKRSTFSGAPLSAAAPSAQRQPASVTTDLAAMFSQVAIDLLESNVQRVFLVCHFFLARSALQSWVPRRFHGVLMGLCLDADLYFEVRGGWSLSVGFEFLLRSRTRGLQNG